MRFLMFLLLSTVFLTGRVSAQSTRPFMTGVDANYSLDLEKAGKTWSAGVTVYRPVMDFVTAYRPVEFY